MEVSVSSGCDWGKGTGESEKWDLYSGVGVGRGEGLYPLTLLGNFRCKGGNKRDKMANNCVCGVCVCVCGSLSS